MLQDNVDFFGERISSNVKVLRAHMIHIDEKKTRKERKEKKKGKFGAGLRLIGLEIVGTSLADVAGVVLLLQINEQYCFSTSSTFITILQQTMNKTLKQVHICEPLVIGLVTLKSLL